MCFALRKLIHFDLCLESNDDINLECLSILVTKAGQNYQAKAASSMDKILESIHSHSDNAAISAKSCKILKVKLHTYIYVCTNLRSTYIQIANPLNMWNFFHM